MAVPKKRTSKTKTRVRKTIWKKKAEKQVSKLFSKINKFEKKKPLRAASLEKNSGSSAVSDEKKTAEQ